MTRNLVALGCAVLLALAVSFSGSAGVHGGSSDGDGIPDNQDNCVVLPNGPLLGTGSCFAQEDADMDGYGNPCDLDVNNNGQVDLIDLSESFLRQGEVPGPSGLACAGTIPCF